jgi:hypothetical protein
MDTTVTKDHPNQLLLGKGGPLWTEMKETVELRDKVVEKRIGMDIQEHNYNAQWKHTSKHLDDFLAAAAEFMNALPTTLDRPRTTSVRDRWTRLQKSAAFLKEWQNQGRSDFQKLSELERTLATKEEHLYHQFRQMLSGPDMSESIVSGSGSTVNFERLSQSSEQTDPLVHDYYDTVGDLHLLHEHIFNFDAEQQRRVFQREMAYKTGEYVSANDRHSYEEYVRGRQALVKEYIDKKHQMEKLRNMCSAQGVKVEAPDLSAFLDLSQRVERPPSPATRAIPERFNSQWRSPDAYLIHGGLDRRNRIIRWRDNVRRALNITPEATRSRSPSRARSAKESVTPAIPSTMPALER